MPKHPEITIKLVNKDGNAFAIIGRCRQALKQYGYSDECSEFTEQATSGDYNNLIATVFKWFDVE